MRHRPKGLRIAAACAVVAALVTGAAPGTAPVAAAASPAAAASAVAAAPDVRFVTVPGSDGVRLAGNVFTPAGRDGDRYPLIVLPTSWATPQAEYFAQAQQLADSGYVVVSYNPRGFLQSGGEIDVAGPKDVADASAVIDWALAETPADPQRVGMGGVSYGAGISLLAAAADERITTVAALSGWADLIDSIYSGRTQHRQAVAMLTGVGLATGRPSEESNRYMKEFLSGSIEHEAEMIAWGKERSAATRVDRINDHGAAIMLANAWGDSIFPPNQYADFFEELTGPKRLQLNPGDHATAEGSGLLGLPNDIWDDTRRWFDHHLKGVDNGIDREQPVQLTSRTGGAQEGYPSWRAVPQETRRIPLTASRTVRTDVDSGANGGAVMLSGALDQLASVPPVASVPLLPRTAAAVWQSERCTAPQRLRGTVRLHTTVTPRHADGTAVAYLYDVGPLGTGRLVTHAPVSFHDRAPGRPFGLDLELFSTAYDVPAGHRLALVVDGADPLYTEHNPRGQKLTFSSPAGDPSWVEVPLRSS